ncbi:MAG: hypothetical protein AAFU84_18100 [Cyanobacteria bacterium J06633_23]
MNTNIDNLLGMLHDSDRLSPTLRAHLARQKRYDGNLREYLSDSSNIIKRYATELSRSSNPIDLKTCRDTFVKELFGVLQD